MDKIKIAVFGASGYSGEELLRILLRHPQAEIVAVTSRQYAGQPLATVFPRFAESALTFVAPEVAAIAALADVAFLSLPHGLAGEYAGPLVRAGVRVIDISADFRLRDPAVYQRYYKEAHPCPELLPQAVYGLPERYRAALPGASLIACAGCYPTSIIIPVSALLAAGVVEPAGIVASSMSGVSGAGRKVDLPYIFPECNESIRPYGVVGHRHLPEIEQELSVAAGAAVRMNFLPHLVPLNRGIHSTIVLQAKPGMGAAEALAAWRSAYGDEPFVRLLAVNQLADSKHVAYSNRIELGVAFDEHTGKLIVSSAIDNLTKGAAGQAVQCMNIALGLDESAGLAQLG